MKSIMTADTYIWLFKHAYIFILSIMVILAGYLCEWLCLRSLISVWFRIRLVVDPLWSHEWLIDVLLYMHVEEKVSSQMFYIVSGHHNFFLIFFLRQLTTGVGGEEWDRSAHCYIALSHPLVARWVYDFIRFFFLFIAWPHPLVSRWVNVKSTCAH